MPSPPMHLPPDIGPQVKVDLLVRVEATLAHPVESVWPRIMHWNTWVDDHIEHRVAGTPDTEGEIKRVTHLDATGRMDAVYFTQVVKIVPQKQLVYKILSPSYHYDAVTGLSSETPLTGYDVFALREDSGQTVVSLDVLAEMSADVAEAEARSLSDNHRRDTEKSWYEKYFPRLRELLANE